MTRFHGKIREKIKTEPEEKGKRYKQIFILTFYKDHHQERKSFIGVSTRDEAP